MAHIGTFQANSNGFEGEVFMVPLTTKGVRIVKETAPNRNPKAPSHRIFVGRSEIGQAWPRPPTMIATISASPSILRGSPGRSTPS